MSVRYIGIDGEQVSAEWYVAIREMRKDGVHANVNEGHRTMARQQYFWNLYRSGRGNLAAYPSRNAPHIRSGRLDHAIDFGNDRGAFSWLWRNGLQPRRTVRGESWHIECPASALVAFARKHGGAAASPYRVLNAKEKKMVGKLKYHRRQMSREKRGGMGPRFHTHLRWARHYKRMVKNQMNAITRVARADGGNWNAHNRAKRYRVLEKVYAGKL